MIRCRIEMVPKGDESRVRLIGVVEIANVGGSETRGTYSVVLKKTPPFPGALRAAWKRGLLTGEDDDAIAGVVEGFHRTQRGSYDLLFRALKACGLATRNP